MFSLEHYEVLRRRAGWLDRQDLGRLRVRGEDRRSYLHGLLTNDIEGLAAAPRPEPGRAVTRSGQGCYAALLTPQGRMITDMYVFERGDLLMVTLPRPLASQVREHLDRFIFSEDVQVEDVTEATAQIGVYGPDTDAIVEALPLDVIDTVMPEYGFGLHGSEIVTSIDRRDSLVQALDAGGAGGVTFETAEVCRIEAGLPRFLVDMTDDTIPLEAGIEDRAISLTKGCYVGQEIIIRILHRGGGRVVRKLVKIAFPRATGTPERGGRLYAAEREVGSITSAAHSPSLRHPIALGYVHRDFAAPGTHVDVMLAGGSRTQGEVLMSSSA